VLRPCHKARLLAARRVHRRGLKRRAGVDEPHLTGSAPEVGSISASRYRVRARYGIYRIEVLYRQCLETPLTNARRCVPGGLNPQEPLPAGSASVESSAVAGGPPRSIAPDRLFPICAAVSYEPRAGRVRPDEPRSRAGQARARWPGDSALAPVTTALAQAIKSGRHLLAFEGWRAGAIVGSSTGTIPGRFRTMHQLPL